MLLPTSLPRPPPLPRRSFPVCSSQNHAPLDRRAVLSLLLTTPVSLFLPPFDKAHASRMRGLAPGVAESLLRNAQYGKSWPYTDSDFQRVDSRPDSEFYRKPRMVRHIDEHGVRMLKRYYDGLLRGGGVRDVLDVCSSVESYLPESWEGKGRVAGVGMNEEEMRGNGALTEVAVRDLNVGQGMVRLEGLEDDSFDLVMCNLSVDYLVRPVEVMIEIGRVLRRGGRVAVSFGDRLFGSKAVAVWTGGGDEEHIMYVGELLHYAGGFGDLHAVDLTDRGWGGEVKGDPVYVVEAVKL